MPLYLVRVFDFEELHMLNRGHWNALSSCRVLIKGGRGYAVVIWPSCANSLKDMLRRHIWSARELLQQRRQRCIWTEAIPIVLQQYSPSCGRGGL